MTQGRLSIESQAHRIVNFDWLTQFGGSCPPAAQVEHKLGFGLVITIPLGDEESKIVLAAGEQCGRLTKPQPSWIDEKENL